MPYCLVYHRAMTRSTYLPRHVNRQSVRRAQCCPYLFPCGWSLPAVNLACATATIWSATTASIVSGTQMARAAIGAGGAAGFPPLIRGGGGGLGILRKQELGRVADLVEVQPHNSEPSVSCAASATWVRCLTSLHREAACTVWTADGEPASRQVRAGTLMPRARVR